MDNSTALALIVASAGCIGYAAAKLRYGVASRTEFAMVVTTAVIAAAALVLTIFNR